MLQKVEILEPGLKSKLAAKAHSADDYCSCKEFKLVNVKANKSYDAAKIVVHCTDLTAWSTSRTGDNYPEFTWN